jgi:hypothetical protein
VIGGEGFLFDEELLFLGADPFPRIPSWPHSDLIQDDIVQVTGTVWKLSVVEIERELG